MIQDTSAQDVVLDSKAADKHRTLYGLIFVAILGLGFIVVPAYSKWSSADLSVDRSRIRTARVVRGELIRDLSLQGNIIAANSPKLYAPEDGIVNLLAKPGDRVKKNQPIAYLESPELTNRLKQEEAMLASFDIELERKKIQAKQSKIRSRQNIKLEQVVLEAAKRELKRAKQSIENQVISQIDYEKALDDLKSSELKYQFAIEQSNLESENQAFELKTLQFEHSQLELKYENTKRLVDALKILAPVSGIVGSWSVEQKSAVVRNQPLLTVVDLSNFEVEIQIPQAYADELGLAMQAKVTYGNGEYDAKVVTISPEVTDNVVKGRLAFTSAIPPGIKQNQRVSSRVLLSKKEDVLYLPNGSFVQHHGGQKAFVIDQGIAKLTDISLGERSVARVEIVNGLKEGQEVIISNTNFVQNARTLVVN